MSTIEQNNSALISLLYKMVDTYPNLTAFGGVVRDVIAPAFFKGQYPFEKSFKTNVLISDLDIIYNWNGDEEMADDDKDQILYRFVYGKLRMKLREWDWKSTEIARLEVYGTEGLRINIEHQILDAKTHIDLVGRLVSLNKDADVNQIRFNQEQGLFLENTKKNLGIKSHFFYQGVMLGLQARLEEKRCQMISFPSAHHQPGSTVLLMRRFVKMIRKGWWVENISDQIDVREKGAEETCMICYENKVSDKVVELKCSRCLLCLDCFQTLLEREMVGSEKFKCPTCRCKIKPWS